MRWHRLTRGEDAVVDDFLAAEADRLHDRLDAANAWHAARRYHLDPPIPRGSSDALYEVDDVHLRRNRPRAARRLVQSLLITASLLWAGYTCYGLLLHLLSVAS